MKIKAVLFGSTGMIGQGVLRECLSNSEVESVLVINRHTTKLNHPKLKEIIHTDLFDLSKLSTELSGYNTCFFCLGVSSAGLSEKDYHHITFDLTLYVAETLLARNTNLTFCYISGAQTDSTEKGKVMWARVKGKTENALLAMPFANAYIFRPGYIQPLHGIKSKTLLYNVLYTVFKPFYFVLKHAKNYVTNTEILGKAMINAVATNYSEKKILESIDINMIGNKE
jgi:uncharacterized protein YbjT (DUF2867 family)